MKKIWFLNIAILSFLACSKHTYEADYQSVKALFINPTRHYSSGPLWVWNDMLTEDQIVTSLKELAEQGIKQVWVHPRPGLMTPYLGEEWFQLWQVALDQAQKLDMNVWIYDENSYPSGFAGGLVPESMPESRGLGLEFSEITHLDSLNRDMLAIYHLEEEGFTNVTHQLADGLPLQKGRYLMASLRLARSSGWFGGKYYVDLLHPGVTDKFIELTIEPYRRRFGNQFGKRIPGWFTDEPHLAPAGGIHWSKRFTDDFKQRWGYDIMDNLPSLVRPLGDYKRIRHNYQKFLLEEFINYWAIPCYEYCEKYNLEFTGHYWEHGWPGVSHGPDNMAMAAWQQRPGIDILMNEYREDVHAQFGNARAVKEICSVANQLGRKRTLCETYGAGGWDLRLEDMKRIGDWIYVLGVNTLNEHLTFLTIRGARKRDHPQTFSYHEPWWEAYHKMSTYFTRLSVALSAGEQINDILLLEPTTTAWIYQPDTSGRKNTREIGDTFQNMINQMEKKQVRYDLGSEEIIAKYGDVFTHSSDMDKTSSFVVGQRKYKLFVLPPNVENLNSPTMDLLEKYIHAGGMVLCCGEPPARIDGEVSERGRIVAGSKFWQQVSVQEALAIMQQQSKNNVLIHRSAGDQGILFHHRRQLSDVDLLFLVNTSLEHHSSGTIDAAAGSVEEWIPESGKVLPYSFSAINNGIRFKYNIPPCGSLLLCLIKEPKKPVEISLPKITTIPTKGDMTIRRIEANVLTLDYVDISVAGESLKNVYFNEAQKFSFTKNGMEGNPWDRAVQLRDELITKEFPASSGFEASYRFYIRDRLPQTLSIVIERADLYTITCNGSQVNAKSDTWWLDKSFGKIDISNVVKIGENVVTIKAAPMTIFHELESAYVLGDFWLEEANSGFAIIPSQPLVLASVVSRKNNLKNEPIQKSGWNTQGHPFYSKGVAYLQKFEVNQPQGRYKITLKDWYGSVARVTVNGEVSGYIINRPWECDVTDWIKNGSNEIEVTVIGTLKNTLGPHHYGAVVGKAWPNMFTSAPETGPPPGREYHTLSYGLYEPFHLSQIIQ